MFCCFNTRARQRTSKQSIHPSTGHAPKPGEREAPDAMADARVERGEAEGGEEPAGVADGGEPVLLLGRGIGCVGM